MRDETLKQEQVPVSLDDPFTELANAIILRAVSDYRCALHRLKKKPDSKKSATTKRECERFFRSGWYATLTDINGELLIRRLKEEITE